MNYYSPWKYVLLVVMIVLGVLYALPNLYGENYAVQISSRGAQSLSETAITQVEDTLKAKHIPFISATQNNDSILVRFDEMDFQVAAQDALEQELGNTFSVALNLAPKTPRWLSSLNASPMKLGLDLRGGIHFLMQVNLNQMIKEVEKTDLSSMSDQLRQENIRYSDLRVDNQHVVRISFRSEEALRSAYDLLSKQFPNYTMTKTQSNEQFSLSAAMGKNALVKLQQDAMSQTISILQSRVNQLGVSEPVITQQGLNQISVDLPGIQDSARAKALIGTMATINLQLQDVDNDAYQAQQSGIIPFGSSLFTFEDRPVLLKNSIILHGNAILNASTTTGQNGRPAVSVRVGSGAATLFNKITAANVGKPLATVYIERKPETTIVDDKTVTKNVTSTKIINIATIQTALGTNFEITGLDSLAEANNLSLLLRSGAYRAPLDIVQERIIGPSLGKQNIQMGVRSCLISSLVVIIFMALYYSVFGLVADLALILNVIFVVAVMSLLGATMTLPGIAGIVLTVGMAVDANVLINERIREELRNGVTPQAAINAGYDRAFSTIVDANVTTLIVAIVLFTLGSGTIKSFAITLTIGLITSMITAIFFTRAIINLLYGRKTKRRLRLGMRYKVEK
ncbi:MAG: protein translocase subunit SecD [Coxiellaceae bacterium]|nr:protein translocase subunit SecD [Coxiellaceae bacterium]|tara:strand:- start:1188 stop:3065 length:1878 start_codon:yes stop_codon:yes gene_type:complete